MSDAVQQNASHPEKALEFVSVSKTYGGGKGQRQVRALDDVSLSVPRGSFFGLLGPNGAGKSTLINILAGLVIRTDGDVRIWGHDIDREMRAARRSIGIVPQELNIDPFFTPREMLELQAGLYGVPSSHRQTSDILDAVGLFEQADSYARRLSGGMRRRLLVAKAMVHAPPILVLDEPTAGVDVELRRQLWAHVQELNRSGTTILLTTHYLEEAEALCDRIAIINRGQVVADEPTPALLKRLDSKELRIRVDEAIETAPPSLAAFDVVLDGPSHLVFHYPPSRVDGGAILAAVGEAGLTVRDVTTREAELEDIFLQLTRPLDADDGPSAP